MPSLPKQPAVFPGLPGGKPFNWDSLPFTPDGADPTSGTLAIDKIIPKGVKHYLATPDRPRKQVDRIPPDEFALMVASYNQKNGTDLPTDPMSPLWKSTGSWWATREAISKVATGRWNSYLCKAGKGHCPHPGLLKWLGHAVSSAVHVIGKVTKVLTPIARLIPGVGQAVGAAEMLNQLGHVGASVVAGNKVLSAGKKLVPSTDHVGYDLGAAIMTKHDLTVKDIAAVRNRLSPNAKRGFDIALSIQTGMGSHQAPKVMTPTQKAAFYATQGMQHAPNNLKKGMLTPIMAVPEARTGVEVAATDIANKSLWQHIKEWFGVYPVQPLNNAAPKPEKAGAKAA